MQLRDWSVDDIASNCVAHTQKFFRNEAQHDPCFCYELLRRAFVESNQDAYTYARRNYDQLMTSWVKSHPWFENITETVEFIVDGGFIRFHLYAGPRFDDFPPCGVAALLKYLRACIHSEIAQFYHPQTSLYLEALEDTLAEVIDMDKGLDADDLLKRINKLLPEHHLRLLVRLRYMQDLKPSEISKRYPHIWPDSRTVSKSLQTIKRRLRGLIGNDALTEC